MMVHDLIDQRTESKNTELTTGTLTNIEAR